MYDQPKSNTQRAGMVHISSMTAFAEAPKYSADNFTDAPWKTHWSRSCEHDLVPRLKRYPTGTRAKMQCRTCGQGVGGNIPMRNVFEMWDDELEQRVSQEYEAACNTYRTSMHKLAEQQRGGNSRKWWELYDQYLQSSVWHLKRILVMERCGGICEACGQADAEHVHHLKYPDVFGREPLWDLRAVCIPCHKIIHPHME